MKFNIKRMATILSDMIDHTITTTNEINDFTPGSSSRVLYEALAIKLEEMYILTKENMQEGIEEGVFTAFDFERKDAQRAYGYVQIEFNNPLQTNVTLPRGSQFLSSSNQYSQIFETVLEYSIPQGRSNAEVEVYCTQPGTIGNVPANTIDTMRTPLPNVNQVRNQESFNTGAEEEPIEDVRGRFQDFIESRGRSTLASLEYATRSVEGVSGVYIREITNGFEIYAHDRNGNLSSRLIEDIDTIVQEYRPAGVPYFIYPVDKVAQDVTVTVYVSHRDYTSNSFRTQVTRRIREYLNQMEVSEDLILSDLSRTIMTTDRKIIRDVQFDTPTENIIVPRADIIRAGDIEVTLEVFEDR